MARASSGRFLPILTAGLVVGLLEIVFAVSFGTLVFSGALSDFVPQGIGLAVLGMALTGIVIALFTSLRGIVGGSQSAPAVIMSVAVAGVAATMSAGAAAEELFVTAAAAIALTTALTGLFLFTLGLFRLGSLGRFLPYPVVGGFLAGTGWLLVTGAINTMIDLPSGSPLLPALFEPGQLIYWLPGLILAMVMLILLRRFDHPLLLPALIFAGIALFYLLAWLSGVSTAESQHAGLAAGPFSRGQPLATLCPFRPGPG